MKLFRLVYILCTMMALASCEKVVLNDETSTVNEENGTATLTISTRGVGDPEEVAEAWIYIFNEADKCVTKLTIDDSNLPATTSLKAGTYTLYAVGGADLSRYTLPIISTATPTSLITLVSGKVMEDLVMKTGSVTLEDGDEKNLTLTLERKVFSLDKIELKSIPTDVTKVEVTLSSFYSAIKLDGTYDATSSTDYTVNLIKQEDGTTWSALPAEILFPSKGVPTITIIQTTATGTDSYTFTAEEALEANHHVTISATHNVAQGAILNVSINAEAWGTDTSVEFEYNETHTVYRPIAGAFCNGYYVVSVDETQRTAVLLAKEKRLEYIAPESGATEAVWRAALTGPMAALDKPINITNDWRLPTLEEVSIFTMDPQAVTISSQGNSKGYFCEDDDDLEWGQNQQDNFIWNTNGFAAILYLRPVIDINY